MMNFSKKLKLLLTITIISFILASCDTASTAIKKIDSDQNINNAPFSKEDQKINEDKIIELQEAEIDLDYPVDWEPRITSTPAKQSQTRFYLPQLNTEKFKTSFYDDMQVKKIEGENINEDYGGLYGLVQYPDETFVHYSFGKEEDKYFGKLFYVAVSKKTIEDFSDFQKDIIYKVIDVSGADNPSQFFQELIDSPKITEYTECIVKQKQSKYVMVEMTFCEDDDRTDISLYKPDSD